MKDISEYIATGILETYVLGYSSEEENREVEKMAALYPEIETEIQLISQSLKTYASEQAPVIPGTVKALVMAVVNYTERLKKGEPGGGTPLLSKLSKPADFQPWLDRSDMTIPADFKDMHARIIGQDEKAFTAILWMEGATPYEVHKAEFENFLILEGSCTIQMKDQEYPLVAGDYFQIPLHAGHVIQITSAMPCKVILQRVAA
jgi:mannose-6-phosphate isomerase-like protein (cupin superfamily)